MPIYAYKCSSCNHAQDVLQKMSDPLLTECPECRQSTYVKQVTAAGFQLKGTGWYVTDFRDGGSAAGKNASGEPAAAAAPATTETSSAPAATSAPAAPASGSGA